MSSASPGRGVGKVMWIVAWALGLFLATRFFGQWQDAQRNPNQVLSSQQGAGFVEVQLLGNGQGHFLASGQINGQSVAFLLDTGATDVAIPGALAEQLGLKRGAPIRLHTANGTSTGYRTQLARLQLGDIVLTDVRALVTPGMQGDEVLLGMSALKQLEFTQRDGTLLLRQTITQ
jgi:aspartyl protease family protein